MKNFQEPDQIKNIIVRMPNWVGDFVMATPILTELRKKFPKASITAMCKEPLGDLLREDVDVDAVFSFQKPGGNFFHRTMGRDVVERLQEGQYDLGVLLPNSFSSAWWYFLGKVKRRIGFFRPIRSLLLTDPVPFPPNRNKQHLVKTYKKLLKVLGIEHSKEKPRLYLCQQVKRQIKEMLVKRGVKADKKLVLIHPGAAFGSAKCWLQDRFTQVAEKLLEDPNVMVVFVGSFEQEELIKNICRPLSQNAINLAGETSLMELACLISLADVFVTNDSGPMHMAAALETPLVALFGSTDPRVTGPYDNESAVIWQRVSCSPCFKRKCNKDFSCMKNISVDHVLEKINKVWKE